MNTWPWIAGDGTVPAAAAARYRHANIRDALRVETHQKCAYCESRMMHVTHDHIEHILPRAHHPNLVVTWTNLTLACPLCNELKGDYDSAEEPLLNPYIDEPAEHLLFVGPVVLERPGSELGYRSVQKLELSRPALIEQRTERIRALAPLVSVWAKEQSAETKRLLEGQIRRHVTDEAEFAAAMRSYLLQAGFPPG